MLSHCEPIPIAGRQRSWSNEGHLAKKYVDEFRQLVKAGGSEELAKRIQAFPITEQLPTRVSVVGHRSELDELKWLTSKPESFLPVGDRST